MNEVASRRKEENNKPKSGLSRIFGYVNDYCCKK